MKLLPKKTLADVLSDLQDMSYYCRAEMDSFGSDSSLYGDLEGIALEIENVLSLYEASGILV